MCLRYTFLFENISDDVLLVTYKKGLDNFFYILNFKNKKHYRDNHVFQLPFIKPALRCVFLPHMNSSLAASKARWLN